MRKTNKRGFTIVELVIVIAVIAILAAVLIPTFTNLVKKANQSADTQLVRNLNTALTVENKDYPTMHDALEVVKEAGYDVAKIAASDKDNTILWDSVNQCFVYMKKGATEPEYIPNTKEKDAQPYQLWKIYTDKTEAKASTYSVYWNGGDLDEITVTDVGFDAGNATVASVKYTGTAANSVVIRTNSASTSLEVNAPAATVYHYGEAGLVNIIAVDAEHCYNENGSFVTATIQAGKIVIDKDSKVGTITVPATATGNVVVENAGTITLLNTINAPASLDVKTNNSGTISTAVQSGTQTVEGNLAESKYNEIKSLTADTHQITAGGYYDGTGITINSTGTNGDSRFAITVNTTDKVVIDGVTFSGLRGVQLLVAGCDFTLINSTVTVSQRGIQLWFDGGQDNSGSVINVINCNLSNTAISEYDNNTTSGTHGIMLNGSENTKVNVMKTTIQGFGYSIASNAYEGVGGNTNIAINVDDSIFKGRAGFDLIMLTDSVINVNNSLIRGINIYSGPTENFGLFVFEAGSNNNTMNLHNCTLEGYRAPATAYNQEYLFNIWSQTEGNTINITGTNTMYEDIYFNVDSENVPSGYEELMPMIYKGGRNNTINGKLVKATCVIHKGDSSVEYDWLK